MDSMTGYGRGAWEGADGASLAVELKSVNNRFLNIRQKLPELLFRHEPRVEARLRDALHRGSVTCQVSYRSPAGALMIDDAALAGAYERLETFRRNQGVPGEVSMATLVALPQALQNPEPDPAHLEMLSEGLDRALQGALDDLQAMRAREGEALASRLQADLKELGEGVEAIRVLAPSLAPKAQSRFLERVAQLAGDVEVDAAALSREIAVLADRADISEELDRLDSHLEQFGATLVGGGPIGRKLDFLLQEINREINTIGSKSSDADLSGRVVGLKTLAERLREQVQNVE